MSTELALPAGEGHRKGAAATYKILIIGDSNVGKTSLLNRYCDETFPSGALISTVGETRSSAQLAMILATGIIIYYGHHLLRDYNLQFIAVEAHAES